MPGGTAVAAGAADGTLRSELLIRAKPADTTVAPQETCVAVDAGAS